MADQIVCSRCSNVVIFSDQAINKVDCVCGAMLLKPPAIGIKYYHDAYSHEIKQMRQLNGEYYCTCCGNQLRIFYGKIPENINGVMVYYQKKEGATFSHTPTVAGCQLDQETRRLHEEIQQLKAANTKLTQDLEGAKNVNQYYYKNLAAIQAGSDAYLQEIEYQLAQNKRITTFFTEKEQQVKKLHKMLEEQTAQLVQYKMMYTEAEEYATKMKEHYIEMDDAHFVLTLNSQEQKETIEYLEKQLGDVTLRCSRANFTLHHKEKEYETVKTECEQLRTLLAKKEQANIREVTAQLQRDLEKMGILSVRVRAEETQYDKEMNQLKKQLDQMKTELHEIAQTYLKRNTSLEDMDTAKVLQTVKGRMEELEVLRELVLFLKEKLEKDDAAGPKEKKTVKALEFDLD